MQAEQILKKHQLRNTSIRRAVLRILIKTNHSVTHAFLEHELQSEYDRVTIYRTLKTFEDNGLVHRILNDTGVVEYGLCKEECGDHDHHKHSDDHVHFRCTNCEKTFCLDDVHIPTIKVPNGYTAQSFQVLVSGTCTACNAPASA